MKPQPKIYLSSFFTQKRRMAVELKKHENGLGKDGGKAYDSLDDVSCSKFSYHSFNKPDHFLIGPV